MSNTTLLLNIDYLSKTLAHITISEVLIKNDAVTPVNFVLLTTTRCCTVKDVLLSNQGILSNSDKNKFIDDLLVMDSAKVIRDTEIF